MADVSGPLPELSIVAPVYNEAAVLETLFERICAAVEATGRSFEVILVDDCSTDGTAEVLGRLGAPLRPCRLTTNYGQIGATLQGLTCARGGLVVVLDGDLQDPPEVIGSLVERMAVGDVELVFATKTRRDDPAWFLVGSGLFHLVQGLAAKRRLPPGAGSYAIMGRELAQRVSRVAVRDANLSALLVALGPTTATVPYEKAARYDGHSRVGAAGLAREALGSLALTGALARALAGLGALTLLPAAGLAWAGHWGGAGLACALALASLGTAAGVHLGVRARLRAAAHSRATLARPPSG